MLRLSRTKCTVSASRYCIASSQATRANSKAERSGVGKVKCRPAFGSTAQKTLAVPRRSYSLSRRASGDRLLIQTDYRFLLVIRPFVYFQDVFHLGDVFFIEVGHHPHFFPPRFEIVAQQENANGFP